jgi:hypothetical protein
MLRKLRARIHLTSRDICEIVSKAHEEDTTFLEDSFVRRYIKEDWPTNDEAASLLWAKVEGLVLAYFKNTT